MERKVKKGKIFEFDGIDDINDIFWGMISVV